MPAGRCGCTCWATASVGSTATSRRRWRPAGVWQAAEPVGDAVLCGCTVAPGFDFADFRMADRDALIRDYPADAELIRRLAR